MISDSSPLIEEDFEEDSPSSLAVRPPVSPPEDEEAEALWEAPAASGRTKLLLTVDEVIQEIGFGRFQLLIFLFCMACWFCTAINITVAAVFIPTVQCEWKLSDNEVAVIPLAFYAGGLLISTLLVFIGDRIGRKKFILIALVAIVVFGVLAGVLVSDQKAIGYPWLLACRFVLGGAYVLGNTYTAIYLCEFLPVKVRGSATFVLQIFFGFGSSLSALEGLLLIKTVGWQWYSAIAVTTPALALLAVIFFPETPRYLFVSGQQKEAQSLLIKVATFNRKDIVNCISVCKDLELKERPVDEKGKFSLRLKFILLLRELSSIFKKDLRRSTLLISYIWFCSAFVYHGGIWLPTALLKDEGSICSLGNDSRLHNSTEDYTCVSVVTLNMTTESSMNQSVCNNNFINDNSTDNSSNRTENSNCANATDDSFYLKIAWTAFADVPGVILSAILIEVIGRKLNIAFTTFGSAISILPLFYCGLAKILDGYVVTAFLFLFRGFQIGAFMTIYLYTSEVYPTRLRGTVYGVFGLTRSIGQLSSPLSALSLVSFNYSAGIALYAGLSLLATVAALLLPIETKGKSLMD